MGMTKNTGKTVALNHLLAQAAQQVGNGLLMGHIQGDASTCSCQPGDAVERSGTANFFNKWVCCGDDAVQG